MNCDQNWYSGIRAWQQVFTRRLQSNETQVNRLQVELNQLHRMQEALRARILYFRGTDRLCAELEACIQGLLRQPTAICMGEEVKVQSTAQDGANLYDDGGGHLTKQVETSRDVTLANYTFLNPTSLTCGATTAT